MKNKSIPTWVGAILGIALGFIVILLVVMLSKDADPAQDGEIILSQITEATESYVEESLPSVDNSVDNVDILTETTQIYEPSTEATEPPTEPPTEETEPPTTEPIETAPKYTEEEVEILAIIIYQEAGGDGSSDDTRRKVGSVFLNRVNSPLFPNTFLEVALQRAQYGSLYWTGLKWPDRHVNPGEAHAVKRAYRIAEELLVTGSILPPNVVFQAEFPQGDGVYCYENGTYFCYKGEI